MNTPFILNIKTPCQENFNQFTKTPNGGFCDSCTQEVVDFTNFSSEEISEYFSTKDTKNTCGRFKTNQLNTKIASAQPRTYFNLLGGLSLACLSIFTTNFAQAQDIKISNNTSKITAQKFQDEFLVKGTVSEDGYPIIGVNVILQGTATGTTTDFDGNFEFPEKLKTGDILIFSAIGMTSKKVVIENKDAEAVVELNVTMESDSVILMGQVAVKEVYKSNRKNK